MGELLCIMGSGAESTLLVVARTLLGCEIASKHE